MSGSLGGKDADGDRYTITVRVIDFETGRPIEGAIVTIGKTGNITVKLPDGTDMDENNRITVIVTDNRKNPLEDENVTVKGDLGQTATSKTDEKGELTMSFSGFPMESRSQLLRPPMRSWIEPAAISMKPILKWGAAFIISASLQSAWSVTATLMRQRNRRYRQSV